MFTYIHLKHLHRTADFPYPAENAGLLRFYCKEPEHHCYDRLEVCLRLSGEEEGASDDINGENFRTPYPHVFWKRPGITHSFHACDHREALFFIYSKEVTRMLAARNFFPQQHPIQRITMTEELNRLIRRFTALMAISEEYSSADRIDLVCFAILEELLFQRTMPVDAIDDRIRRIASILQINAEGTPDIETIAMENGFSKRSFYRHWKNVFSMTPVRYVFEQKMKRASWLLTHSSMRISEIARMLSFSDDNSFSTAFRRYCGISPRSFRNKNKSA